MVLISNNVYFGESSIIFLLKPKYLGGHIQNGSLETLDSKVVGSQIVGSQSNLEPPVLGLGTR